MSAFTSRRAVSSESAVTCHTAHFATRWLHPSMVIITAHGELDAANAQEFVTYSLRHAEAVRRLVLDLKGVEFFGTAGFSALHNLNVRCAASGVDWALVPSKSVNRLLSICDPDGALPVQPSIDTALDAVHGEPRRLLKLVPQPR
jgi:anti-anti-sigma factor